MAAHADGLRTSPGLNPKDVPGLVPAGWLDQPRLDLSLLVLVVILAVIPQATTATN